MMILRLIAPLSRSCVINLCESLYEGDFISARPQTGLLIIFSYKINSLSKIELIVTSETQVGKANLYYKAN